MLLTFSVSTASISTVSCDGASASSPVSASSSLHVWRKCGVSVVIGIGWEVIFITKLVWGLEVGRLGV